MFHVAYTKCVATLWHDRIYLLAHESRAPVTWSSVIWRTSKPNMYALRTYLFFFFFFGGGGGSNRVLSLLPLLP